MCIIAYKPASAAFPNKKILQNCFANNPDGGGYMFAAPDGQVHIVKGLMTFTAFYNSLKNTRVRYGDKLPYILHFRISTQAGNRADCTHPFPISPKMADLRKLKTRCSIGVAHNGIISLTSRGYNRTITYNDTMDFIVNYLSLIIDDADYYKQQKILTLIERLADSRLAILDGQGHCEIIGNGWECTGGVWYSNNTYQERPTYVKYQSITPYNHYGIDEDIEQSYNPRTGLYEFDSLDCPVMRYGDDSYCDDCASYLECYGVTNKKGDKSI